MSLPGRWVRRDPGRIAMGVLWTAFLGGYILFFYHFRGAREIADAELDGYLEVVLLGVPLVVLFGSIVWMAEANVDRSLHHRIVVWTVGVAGLFLLAVTAALFVLDPQYDRGEYLLIRLMSAGFGASMGTVTGIVETRSIHRGRAKERAAVEAQRREHEQQRLEYLNQYLRHEVLNEVNKINGYAALLASQTEDETREWARIVEQSSDEIGTFISSIRSLMTDCEDDLRLRPVDVTTTVEDVVERARTGNADGTVTVDAPESAHAAAGDLLDRVFLNLVENAIDHADDPIVHVDVQVDDEFVTVAVHDDGPGIPSAVRETLFEPPESGDHGYGLFLSRHLVELYGGRLRLSETGPDGTTFTVRLEAVAEQCDVPGTAEPIPA